jgi:hypothetical protein
MLELGLMAALFFILIAIIASYLLKGALQRSGETASSIEKTKFIAIGMPPISSVKAKFIAPGIYLPGTERLGAIGRVYLFVVRTALFLAVLATVVSIVFEVWVYA